ncbi:MAG: hypothetical protein RSA49_00085 [Anaerovoracaceae bacterium]
MSVNMLLRRTHETEQEQVAATEPVPVSRMKKAELIEFALAEGFEVNEDMTVAEIRDIIENGGDSNDGTEGDKELIENGGDSNDGTEGDKELIENGGDSNDGTDETGIDSGESNIETE